VANRLVADTVSRSSTTWMVADSLWGSTPMNTLDMSFAFPVVVGWLTPGGHCY
jgi:hypothetical protein